VTRSRTLVLAVVLAGLWAAPAQATPWCGTASTTDRAPNAVAGLPIHVIYVIPSDGADRLAQLAPAIQSDAQAIDGWWRSQDPTRAPRFDLAPFPCGPQVDLTSVRLPESGAALAPTDGRFETLVTSLFRLGFGSTLTKYVAYYDGPVADPDICGTGGGDPAGIGFAFVFVEACSPFVPTSVVAAHELIHTFGAVPDGAPHDCAPPDDGHTCDNPQDIMYPYADESALAAFLLDPGRDDYYGHSGPWPDVQDSPWLVQLDRQVPLQLALEGSGEIVTDLPGLDCTTSCTTAWNAGTALTLVPRPAPGMRLVRWSGACSGNATCLVRLDAPLTASALFAPETYRVSVTVSGRGVVRSVSTGLSCGTRCSASFGSYVPVSLVAQPARGWRFKAWARACRGTKPSCTLPLTGPVQARATFVKA
jgi:hypothetical protein